MRRADEVSDLPHKASVVFCSSAVAATLRGLLIGITAIFPLVKFSGFRGLAYEEEKRRKRKEENYSAAILAPSFLAYLILWLANSLWPRTRFFL
jgi:hypothetical protein